MHFGSPTSFLLRLAGSSSISVAGSPPRRAISVLVANFSSLNRTHHEEDSRNVTVSVRWDFENCTLPSDSNVFRVAQNITSAVRFNGIKGPITITAFGDVSQLSRSNQEALSATGITLTHVPQGGKNSADRSLITDLMCWVTQNPPPAHLFLISSDADFSIILHRLRMRNYNILLAGFEEKTTSVLCSAASIMWDWKALVKGKDFMGRHINQPPDGPYNSWYGHYRTPLLDPFATTKRGSCAIVKTEESNPNHDSGSWHAPEEVVKQIRLVLSLYPKGVSITELREQLNKRKVQFDKDFYGFKKFSSFLFSMPKILRVVSKGDGVFLIRACIREMDNKASSLKVRSEDPKVFNMDEMQQNVEDVKEESQSQGISQECVPISTQMDMKAKEEPVKENQLALTGGDDVSSSKEKDGFFKKLRLWFGSLEMELKQLQEKKLFSGNRYEDKGVVSEGEALNKDLETQSSTSSESAYRKLVSPGFLSRVLNKFKFFRGRNTVLCNATETETQVDDIFRKDLFWKNLESFLHSPRGFVVVSHSKSREALAKNLKDEGPSSLKPLSVSKILDLVSLLVSEKKWIKENSLNPLPFRVARFTEKTSGLSNPLASNVLRSLFVNMSKSQCVEDEKESKNIDTMSKKASERSRSDVIADCHKLIKKITEENPEGYNMGKFKKDFERRFGYRLNHQNIGYQKLQCLIQSIPEAKIESGHIVPSTTPSPCNKTDSSLQELGSVSEEGDSDEEATLKQRKKKEGDETQSDLLQILGCCDVKKSYGFEEDKLVDGILTSLRKKPSCESTIQA